MAQSRRRRVQDDPLADTIGLLGLAFIGAAWLHKLPAWAYRTGHAAMAMVPAALRRPLMQALGPHHADLADLLPYVAAFVLLLVVLAWLGDRRERRRRYTLGELLVLTPQQFEEFVTSLMRRRGYRDVRRVGGRGDLNADITARDREGRRVVVQCKCYSPANRIGSPTMQTFIGMVYVHHKAERGLFVTTSSYTDDARALAHQHSITLLDGTDLMRLVGQRNVTDVSAA